MNTINTTKLHQELVKAGIPIHGVSSDGRIDFKDATNQQKDLARTILDNHNPIWYVEQRTGADGYAPITDQLDMIYKDKLNGTNTWVEHITAVKLKFPK